ADRNRSHRSTSKTPSYTKSVSWQHHHFFNDILYSVRLKNISKLENMEFCATKQRVYFSDKNKKASYKIINYGDYYDVDYYDNNLKNEVFDWIGKWS
ncbi:hypothetical protein POX64_23435, partial [Escherichia coli]